MSIFAGIDRPADGLVPRLLDQTGADTAALRADLESELDRRPRVSGRGTAPGQVSVTARLAKVLDAASREAKRLKDEYVSVEHLVIALAEEGSPPPGTDPGFPRRDPGCVLEALTKIRGNQRVTSATPEGSYEALEKYGRDLVAEGQAGKLDPVIGRDAEIRRVIQILSRKTKNNPVLIGDPEWARRRSWRGWLSGLCAATSRKACGTRRSSLSIWAPWWRAPSTVASSRNDYKLFCRRSRRAKAESCCSSTNFTPSSVPARPKVPWTPATCSSRCSPAASCT